MRRLVDIFRAAHKHIRPRTPVPDFNVSFFPFAGLSHTVRVQSGVLHVRISDQLEDAPPEILASIAYILLSKLYRKKIDSAYQRLYRTFVATEAMQERIRTVARSRSRKVRSKPDGRHFHLGALFDRLNATYFDGTLSRPALTWSARTSRYTLGRYDSVRDSIVINRMLDAVDVPEYVVEYVVYHEMLHIKHPGRRGESRRVIHSREFRKDEKLYEHFRAAKVWLKEAPPAD